MVVLKKTQGLNLNIQHCRQILYCWATREDSFLSYHNANITLFLPISTVSSFLLFLLSCQRSISSIFKNETSFFKSSFLKTVFSFKINAFILFFLTCDLFCKNLWFFFQNLMKNFNSCMKHKLQFQPRCPWVVRNDCVQWRNWGNFNDNTNVQGFCDPGIESNYSCGVKIEMTEFMSRFLSGKLEIKKKQNTHWA